MTMMRYVARAGDGPVDRTVKQLAKGLGYDVDGLSTKQVRQRYWRQIRRTLSYLTDWGLLDGRHALYEPNGEGRCIVIALSAGVAQSVRAGQYGGGGGDRGRRGPHVASGAPFRGGPGAGQHFFSGEVPSPLRERRSPVTLPLKDTPRGSETSGRARASGPGRSPSHERFLVHAARRQALVAATVRAGVVFADQGIWRVGVELPPLAANAPVVELARELCRLALPGVSPAISPKRRSQLEAAAARFDHYTGEPGGWVRYACSVLADWSSGGVGPYCSEPPRSLGALALELRREANTVRYGALRRRPGRIRTHSGHERRQLVKQRYSQRRWRPGRD